MRRIYMKNRFLQNEMSYQVTPYSYQMKYVRGRVVGRGTTPSHRMVVSLLLLSSNKQQITLLLRVGE